MAGITVVHAALSLTLLPRWMFSKYPDAARLLASGRMAEEAGGDFSPAYLLLNRFLAPEPIRVLQALAGSAAVFAVFAIARRCFGGVAAYCSAILFAVALPIALYEATLEPDLLIAALDIGAVALLVAPAHHRARDAVAAGALLGLSFALRPTAALVVALCAAMLVARGIRAKASRPALTTAMVLIAASLACGLGPTLAVRAAAGSELGATMSVGAVLQMGSRPEGTGLGTAPPVLLKLLEAQQFSADTPDSAHALYRRFARADLGPDISATQAELYWVKKTLAFAAREPLAFARLLGRKLQYALVAPDGHDLAEVRRASAALQRWPLASAGLLGMLGLFGLLVASLRRRVDAVTFAAFAALVATELIFYVVSRYRLTLIPFFCVWAGALVAFAREALADRRARWALAGGAALTAGFLLVSSHAIQSARTQERLDRASTASAAFRRSMRAGDLGIATEAFAQVHAAAPYTLLVQELRGIPFDRADLRARAAEYSARTFGDETDTDAFALAALAVEAGHCDEAIPVFEQLAASGHRQAIFDVSLDPDLMRARCLLQMGAREDALRAIEDSLRRHPGTAEGLAFRIAGLAAAKRGALAPLVEELSALHDPLSAAYALAQAHVAWGSFDDALEQAQRLVAALPDSAEAHYTRARALVGLKRDREALADYDLALQLFPRHGFDTAPFDTAVQAALQQQPVPPEILSLAAEHALRTGDYARARALASEASSQFGTSVPEHHRERLAFLAHVRAGAAAARAP